MLDRKLDELFQSWRSEPLPAGLSPGDARAGAAGVAAALQRVAARKRKRRGVQKVCTALALAAGITGVGIGTWFELRPQPILVEAAASVVIRDRRGDVALTDSEGSWVSPVLAIGEGYGVRTENGSATLAFPSGANVTVMSMSSLAITRTSAKEAFFLFRGGVDVEVPRLDPAHGFAIATPDALVTVHGTRFSVRVEPTRGGPLTHVHVTRGIVSVQKDGREVFLTPGEDWPRTDAARTPSAADEAPLAADHELGVADDHFAKERVSKTAGTPEQCARATQSKAPEIDSRELGDQNERFTRAMAAKKRGDVETALRELDAILRRYPGSPLSQELRVERLRLLRSIGRGELAAREAGRYLREFPQGYAVLEAEELLPER